ncbi:hypothetical protein K1Y78_24110 [Streptomyces sp. tea 10]|nr:hypothetical protein [Streptomyces sp. tea 10]
MAVSVCPTRRGARSCRGSRPPRLPPGPERDNVAADLKARYEAGTSLRAIAEATGRSYGAVHGLLGTVGVSQRAWCLSSGRPGLSLVCGDRVLAVHR